jgi:hypothetical protein
VTTAERPPGEASSNGRESTAAAMRRQREDGIRELTLGEVYLETQDLGRTMGAACLNLVALQKETWGLAERTERARVETLELMNGLTESARRSFREMEEKIGGHGEQIRDQLSQLRAESVRLAGRERWQLRVFVVGGLTACLLAGLGGWRIKEWRAETAAAEERAALRQSELFGMYMLEVHPKEAEKYWRGFQNWARKNGIKE